MLRKNNCTQLVASLGILIYLKISSYNNIYKIIYNYSLPCYVISIDEIIS